MSSTSAMPATTNNKQRLISASTNYPTAAASLHGFWWPTSCKSKDISSYRRRRPSHDHRTSKNKRENIARSDTHTHTHRAPRDRRNRLMESLERGKTWLVHWLARLCRHRRVRVTVFHPLIGSNQTLRHGRKHFYNNRLDTHIRRHRHKLTGQGADGRVSVCQ